MEVKLIRAQSGSVPELLTIKYTLDGSDSHATPDRPGGGKGGEQRGACECRPWWWVGGRTGAGGVCSWRPGLQLSLSGDKVNISSPRTMFLGMMAFIRRVGEN